VALVITDGEHPPGKPFGGKAVEPELEAEKRTVGFHYQGAFVVAGGKDLAAFGSAEADAAQNTSNIFYPGYVTDGQNKALMQNCKGFLHPAVFEGFGIPPLEALSLGAPIALARASCLPELYGDTARYFDPYDYDVDLDALFAKPAAPPDKVLAKYSWEKTARFWLDEIKKCAEA